MFIFCAIFTYPISTSSLVKLFLFQIRRTDRFFALCLIIKSNVRYVVAVTCIERPTKLQRSCQQMVVTFFLFSLNQLGCFPIEQIISIRWAKRIRKCRYNVVRTCLMLKQRCSNLILANYSQQIVTFLLSFFVDLNRLVLSEIILVKGIDYSILLSVVGFVEHLGGDIIYSNILQCYVKYIQLKNSLLKYITKKQP